MFLSEGQRRAKFIHVHRDPDLIHPATSICQIIFVEKGRKTTWIWVK